MRKGGQPADILRVAQLYAAQGTLRAGTGQDGPLEILRGVYGGERAMPRMGVQAHVGRDALGQVRKQRLPVRVEQLGMRAEGKMVKERVRDGREGAQQKLDEFQVDHRRAMPCRHGVRRAQQPFPRAPVFPEGLRAARGEHHRAGRQADGFPVGPRAQQPAAAAVLHAKINGLQLRKDAHPAPLELAQEGCAEVGDIVQHGAAQHGAKTGRQPDILQRAEGKPPVLQLAVARPGILDQPPDQRRLHAAHAGGENLLIKDVAVRVAVGIHDAPGGRKRIVGRAAGAHVAAGHHQHVRSGVGGRTGGPNGGGSPAGHQHIRCFAHPRHPFIAPAVRPWMKYF